jgi:hypothetical protein
MNRGAKLKGTYRTTSHVVHCCRKLGYCGRRGAVPAAYVVLQERGNREENEEHRTRRSKEKKEDNLEVEKCETEK